MALRRLRNVPGFVAAVFGMVKLAWHAQPACFAGLIALDLVQGIVPLANAWIIKALFDLLAQVMRQNTQLQLPPGLLFLLATQAVLMIVGQLITPANSYLHAELGRRLSFHIQELIYTKISGLSGVAPFEDPRLHNSIHLAAGSAQFAPLQALGILMILLRSLVTLVAFLGVLIAFSPLLAAVVGLAVLPQLYGELQLSRRRVGLAFENSPKERLASYYGMVLSDVHFAKEVRLFNLGDHFLRAFRRSFQEIHQAQRHQQARELRWQTALAILSSLVAGAAFVLVVLQAFAGRLSLGDVTLYVSAVGSVQSSLSSVVVALSQVNESVLFYTHFADLLALPQPLPLLDSPHPVPPLQAAIELRNVSFRYSDQHPWILRNVNLTIPAGRCTALVGLNGAGKTTLVKLLVRLYDPTEGQILWDGIDIRTFAPHKLRRRIGAIFQDFLRYDLTAYENIGLGDVERMEHVASVQRAAMRAGVHHTIEELPQGYKTVLSRWLAADEIGVDLSGGQWQKIALARMFMRSSDLLILDEPTAALDAQAEYELYRRFVELVAGRTSLLISHRLSTIRMADLIAVIADGQITEYGAHDELVALGGCYAKLYQMQAEQYR